MTTKPDFTYRAENGLVTIYPETPAAAQIYAVIIESMGGSWFHPIAFKSICADIRRAKYSIRKAAPVKADTDALFAALSI